MVYIRHLGFIDLFVVSLFTGTCLFLAVLIYQRAKEHPLNSQLRKAHKIDEYIQKQLASNLYREDFDSLPPVMGEGDDLYSVEKCGSVMEGYGFFSVEVTGTEQDIDVMVSPKLLSVQETDVEETHTPLGFVWVRMSNLLQRIGTFKTSELLQVLKKRNLDFVSASAIYQHFLRIAQSRSEDGDFDVVQNEPAITFKAKAGYEQKYGYMRVIDIAVSLIFSGWPNVAVEWLNRESRDSRHLSIGTIQKVARSGCHLVYKPSGISEDPELDWRYSFSKAEKTLLQYHSDKHALKLCYIMLRYAYKKHLKPRLNSKKVLASYYLKTMFLWLAETETGFDYYNLHDRQLGALFEFMVQKLKDSYNKHLLPHYFIHHWNLLRGFSKEDLKQVQDFLEDLSRNSKDYITYIHDTRKYIAPLAKQNGGTYNELLKIIDESYARQLLAQVLIIASSTFATLVFVKCVLNVLSLDIALCSL
ncbi:hypothetical protein OS493_006408 [Desmophyllum pertusum]|uniref:Mab-21-like HhH/H2TH-like domain-containing protein n=1 Tax=Desmophyllum pertusum TaxID=174260 RepID=A0A9X0DCX5_9CNID|nr:hypothetical protein OS493_006408 [Desmophyllum pertusum]